MNIDLQSATILLTVHGSQSYGMATLHSDWDLDGVCIAPMSVYLGFAHQFEQQQFRMKMPIKCNREVPAGLLNEAAKVYEVDRDPHIEGTIFDIKKFFRLAADCNPNIIEILFTADEDVIHCTKVGEKLRELGPKFLSQKAKFTFSGYAMSQLKRIRTHRRWLLEPPKTKPERADYGLSAHKSDMPRDEIGAVEAIEDKDVIPASIMAVYEKERAYRNAKKEWDLYTNWKRTRNRDRAELEERFGYDTKHASHLVRLMRMAEEILTLGEVYVKRPDADEILAIRRGEWSYDEVVSFAEEMDSLLTELYEAGRSPLPKSPDRNALDEACRSLILDHVLS